MSDKKDPDTQLLADSSRRRFLAGAAALGVGAATLSACGASEQGRPVQSQPLTPADLDKKLHEQVKTIVVIYAENRSFNNLFANFPGVEKPLSALKPADYQQRDRDAAYYKPCHPPGAGSCKSGLRRSMG